MTTFYFIVATAIITLAITVPVDLHFHLARWQRLMLNGGMMLAVNEALHYATGVY